uniref:Uncharacterized protein n=1 Tax=Desertifilum tharense IPPAS B-1220 TaxID=1781255 RepID=A0ACD5GXI3_9CYAN
MLGGWGKKKGVGNWELGVREEEKIGRLDNCQLSTLFPLGTPLLGVQATVLGTLHSFPTQHAVARKLAREHG